METSLPNWLEEQSPTDPVESDLTLEHTLEMTLDNAISSQRRVAQLRLSETIFDLIYEDTLDRLMLGHPLTDIVSDYNEKHPSSPIATSHFQRWMLKDKRRKVQFDEAMEMGSHIVMGEMIRIADGVDNPLEDVQRSTLRVTARKIALKAYNRRQFGEDTSAPSSSSAGGITVNITGVVSPYTQSQSPMPTITDNNLTIDV